MFSTRDAILLLPVVPETSFDAQPCLDAGRIGLFHGNVERQQFVVLSDNGRGRWCLALLAGVLVGDFSVGLLGGRWLGFDHDHVAEQIAALKVIFEKEDAVDDVLWHAHAE